MKDLTYGEKHAMRYSIQNQAERVAKFIHRNLDQEDRMPHIWVRDFNRLLCAYVKLGGKQEYFTTEILRRVEHFDR